MTPATRAPPSTVLAGSLHDLGCGPVAAPLGYAQPEGDKED